MHLICFLLQKEFVFSENCNRENLHVILIQRNLYFALVFIKNLNFPLRKKNISEYLTSSKQTINLICTNQVNTAIVLTSLLGKDQAFISSNIYNK